MSAAAITVDTRQISALADVLNRAALEPGDRRQLLINLAEEVRDISEERFETKRGPDGSPWKAISDRHAEYLAARFPGAQPPLVVSGELRDTMERQVSTEEALVGATKVYAAVHQFGWPEKNIPAREYLGIGSEGEPRLAEIAADFLESRLSERRAA